MVHAVLSNPTLDLLEQVARFGERRHEILAGNIANISTPTYRMRDLPVAAFQKALREAVVRGREGHLSPPTLAPQGTSTKQNIEELLPDNLFQAKAAEPDNLTFQDANNRSLEHQTMELTKNSMMQNLALEIIRFQMNTLQATISERA